MALLSKLDRLAGLGLRRKSIVAAIFSRHVLLVFWAVVSVRVDWLLPRCVCDVGHNDCSTGFQESAFIT